MNTPIYTYIQEYYYYDTHVESEIVPRKLFNSRNLLFLSVNATGYCPSLSLREVAFHVFQILIEFSL